MPSPTASTALTATNYATLGEAWHLDWGFVTYPPLTPAIAALATALVGPSTVGLRLFSGLAQAAAMVLTGLMARELGGGRRAMVVAAVAAAIAPLALTQGALFQYVGFDYLSWVLIAYCTIRLLKDNEPRWWLGIGAAAGLGLMNRYTIGFYLLAVAAALLLRRRGAISSTAGCGPASAWLSSFGSRT